MKPTPELGSFWQKIGSSKNGQGLSLSCRAGTARGFWVAAWGLLDLEVARRGWRTSGERQIGVQPIDQLYEGELAGATNGDGAMGRWGDGAIELAFDRLKFGGVDVDIVDRIGGYDWEYGMATTNAVLVTGGAGFLGSGMSRSRSMATARRRARSVMSPISSRA